MKPKAQTLSIPLSVDQLNRNFDCCIQEITGDQILGIAVFGTTATISIKVEALLALIPKPRLPVLVTITGNATGGGKYNGTIMVPPTSDISSSTTLAASDFGTTGNTTCLILNTREVGQTTHDLSTSGGFLPQIFPGTIIRINSNGTPVVAIDGDQWENCS